MYATKGVGAHLGVGRVFRAILRHKLFFIYHSKQLPHWKGATI